MSTPTQHPHEFDTLHEQPVVIPDDISTLHALTDTPKAEVSPAIPAATPPAPAPVKARPRRTRNVLLGILAVVVFLGLIATAIVLQINETSKPAPQAQTPVVVAPAPVVTDMSGGPDVAERAGIAYLLPGGVDVAERAGLARIAQAAALDDGMAGGVDVAERAIIAKTSVPGYWKAGGVDVLERAGLVPELSGGPDVAERAGVEYLLPGGPDVAERAGILANS